MPKIIELARNRAGFFSLVLSDFSSMVFREEKRQKGVGLREGRNLDV